MTESNINGNGSSKIYFIGIDKIINNELNEVFKVEDLDELRNGIEMYGLKQPISVVRSDDKFKIISGHRRIAAIRQIFAANKTIMFSSRELSNQVPCIFENEFENEDDEFLNLCSSNNYRKLSPEEVRPIVIRCSEILEKRLQAGQASIEGTTKRDVIAKMAGVSARTVDKYLKSDDNLSDKTKIKSVNSIVNTIDKYISFISDIEMDEYGRSDKERIKESLMNLISICKRTK
ncbi:MAG: ParB N-terminal domain-containing protein [Erysipelotrichaceae bacterium]|nr:ParB N-terminal domain-containing protein [Erysipelotrichaceae bacterium]